MLACSLGSHANNRWYVAHSLYLSSDRAYLKIRANDDGNVFNPTDVFNPVEDACCTDHLDPSIGIVTITVVGINDPLIPAADSFTISESATGSAAFNDLVVDQFPWWMPTFPETAPLLTHCSGSSTASAHD
jgi:hypothetical protein